MNDTRPLIERLREYRDYLVEGTRLDSVDMAQVYEYQIERFDHKFPELAAQQREGVKE